jgi:hypothetical protein
VVFGEIVVVMVVGMTVVVTVVEVVVVIPIDNGKDVGGRVVRITKGLIVAVEAVLEKSNTGGFRVVGTGGIHGTHGPDVVVVVEDVVDVGGSVVSIYREDI